MRKLHYISTLVLSLGLFGYANSSLAQSAMTGTPHDITSGDICITCHTPHSSGSQLVPLWNHETTAVASYTMYSSGSMKNVMGTEPGNVSKACLSCHDGTVAIDSYGGATGNVMMNGNELVGSVTGGVNDLSSNHPIAVTYNHVLDTGLKDVTTLTLPLYGPSNDQVGCASCHNPHDNTNSKFLRVSNTSSGLCINCHVK